MKGTHRFAGRGRIESFGLLTLVSLLWLGCSTQPEGAKTSASPEAPPASPHPVSLGW